MKFRRLHRNIKIRLLEQLMSTMVGNMVWPFMVIYFSERFGAQVTGMIFIFNIVAALFAGIYGGYLADMYGRRKVLLGTAIVRFMAQLLMAIAISPWLDAPVIVFMMVTIQQVMNSLSKPAGDAMIIDASAPDVRKYVYTLQYWFWNISMLVGMVAGSFLFMRYRVELLGALVVLALLSVVLLKFFIQDTYTIPVKTMKRAKTNLVVELMGNYKSVVKDRVFRLYFVATIFMLALQFQSQNYTAVRFATEMPIQTLFTIGQTSVSVDGLKLYGILSSTNTVLIVLIGLLVGRMVRRYSDHKVLVLGILFNAAGYAGLSMMNHPYVLFGMVLLLTIGELMWTPIKQAMLAEIVPDDKRGTYMAVYNLAFRGASVLGALSLIIGAYLPYWGIGAQMVLLGCAAIWLFGRIRFLRRGKQRHEDAEVFIANG